ncbi:hypothetical protein ABMA28_011429 [Loxostege sticticalis]|uniref:Protein phosphatase 1 regulatory subunit 15A/B C-terminal domain-containing protein n=1 Tax=Loxostege sticticalis TaxID=481309 RepID=A0ABD0S556_LOXSC
MYSMGSDWRKRHTMFDPSRFSIENYCTDTKKEMKHSFGDELLNNLHLLPDPLKKNLADSIITTGDAPKQRNKTMLNMEAVETVLPEAVEASPKQGASPLPTLAGITSFFSGVMNVISSAMFLRRSPSPPRYYDCCDESNVSRQGSPVSWHTASTEDQNKNVRAHDLISNSESDLVSDMNKDCRDAVAQCEDKLNRLRLLLKSKPVETPNNYSRRPRKVSVSPPHQKTVIEVGSVEKQSPNIQDNLTFANEINSDDISSVENSPAIQSVDRLSNASVNSQSDEKDYFDEISGRFHSTSATESEDSFQIVFTDSPQTQTRPRVPSDCESEDSFIVFEESPDSCYTSNDVFGNESESDGEYSDSDDNVSDSGCVPLTKLAHPLSRTFGDLTDDSLYEDKPVDEVDCAVRTVCEEIPCEDLKDISEVCETDNEVKSTGLLLNDAKKALRKDLPPKKVHFSPNPPKVHVMRVWAFAARQARAGHWERCAIDRDRFKRRIADVDMAVSWVLKPQHRSRVMFQRFMPWWNAQKRKEIAEKKQKDAEDKLRAEAEKIKEEEESTKLIAEAEKIKEEELLSGEENTKSDTEEITEGNNVVENGEKNITSNGILETGQNKINVKEMNTDVKEIGNKEIKEQKPLQNKSVFESTKKTNIKIDCTKTENQKIVAVNGNVDSKLEINGTLSGT